MDANVDLSESRCKYRHSIQRLQAEEREVNDRLLRYRKQGFHCSADVLADRLNGLRRRIDEAQRVQAVRSAK